MSFLGLLEREAILFYELGFIILSVEVIHGREHEGITEQFGEKLFTLGCELSHLIEYLSTLPCLGREQLINLIKQSGHHDLVDTFGFRLVSDNLRTQVARIVSPATAQNLGSFL